MIKNILKKSPIFPVLRNIYRRLKKIPRHPIQDTPTIGGFDIIQLGSEYGGWSLVDEDCLKGCTIISAGLGEDASFDVEFDELNVHKGFARVTEMDKLLKSNGYMLLKTDGVADFLYFKC